MNFYEKAMAPFNELLDQMNEELSLIEDNKKREKAQKKWEKKLDKAHDQANIDIEIGMKEREEEIEKEIEQAKLDAEAAYPDLKEEEPTDELSEEELFVKHEWLLLITPKQIARKYKEVELIAIADEFGLAHTEDEKEIDIARSIKRHLRKLSKKYGELI